MDRLPVIGITLGDPKGIGPEIVAKAVLDPRVANTCNVQIFGDETAPAGLSDIDAGSWSAQWVAQAVRAAIAGEVDAVVTAPINKSRWEAAGFHFAGHTEYLAHLVGQTPTSIAPIFVSPSCRVALVTGHVSLKNVPRLLTRERVVSTAMITAEFLRRHCGIEQPRLACLGLNPHAGEETLLGLEEEEIIKPAISLLHDRGIHVDGPFPADTFFVERGTWNVGRENIGAVTSNVPRPTSYDAVLAMYHDQGLIPLKSVHFAETVQITMGLPFIRTSVDHGTAEDIAGKGVADHSNMIAAIEMAMKLCACPPERSEG